MCIFYYVFSDKLRAFHPCIVPNDIDAYQIRHRLLLTRYDLKCFSTTAIRLANGVRSRYMRTMPVVSYCFTCSTPVPANPSIRHAIAQFDSGYSQRSTYLPNHGAATETRLVKGAPPINAWHPDPQPTWSTETICPRALTMGLPELPGHPRISSSKYVAWPTANTG